VPDLLERGVTASAIRYTFLTAHYRSKLNFTFEALGAAAEAVRRIVGTHDRLRAHPRVLHPAGDDRPTLEEASSSALGAFTAAMDDDLNTSVALSAVMELVRRVNSRLDGLAERPISEAEAAAGLDAFRRLDSVLGILSLAARERAVDDDLSAIVEGLIRDRQEARASRDFARADSIRDELTGMGITLEDTPTGPRWSRNT
jgi:cysteinyl-tRNA synthetase